MKIFRVALLWMFCFAACLHAPAQAEAAHTPGVVPAEEVQRLMPATVYYSGQSATVQVRNAGAFRFRDGKLALAGLVDTSGYSTAQRERYQFYLITEVPLEANGKRLPPGAYGCGFLEGPGFLVMDLGENELFHTATTLDSSLKRPRPLQITEDAGGDGFRLYLGRSYVTLRRAK